MLLASPSAHLRHPSRTASAALVAVLLACSGRQLDGGDRRADEAIPRLDATPSGAAATANDESNEPGAPARPPANGPLDTCTSITWTDPAEPKREALCSQRWDESGPEPVLRYVCSCDVNACPLHVPAGQELDGPPSVRLNDCAVDGVASGCGDSLWAACGLPEGQHGYCEREYYGLTPTRPEQTPPASATLVCFEQPDGSHACQCPNTSGLVPTAERDCHRALLTACQAPCGSVAGQCTPTVGGYECVCTAGFTRAAETGLCDYALFHACEPQCSNERGACYWDPSGGPDIICRCNGDAEAMTLQRDPNVVGDACRTPLVDTCGGSSEGPSVWPQ